MFEKILARIARCLAEKKIPYMVIGGQAVLIYGEPRLTRDIDITLGVDTDDLNNVLGVIRKVSLRPLPKNIKEFVIKTSVLPTIDEKTGIRVDFIFSFTPYETLAIKRARKVMIAGQSVNFASCEDVIIHKIFAGRSQDIEDVKNILLKNPALDRKYTRKWLKKFGAVSNGHNYVKIFDNLLKR